MVLFGRRRHLPKKFGLRSLLIFIATCSACLGVYANWEFLPGTFRRDNVGLPHGTGVERLCYRSGAVRSESRYRNGVVLRARWYDPEGVLVAESDFSRTSGGIGYVLHNNGVVKRRVPYFFFPGENCFLAHGQAEYFDESGRWARSSTFVRGVETDGE